MLQCSPNLSNSYRTFGQTDSISLSDRTFLPDQEYVGKVLSQIFHRTFGPVLQNFCLTEASFCPTCQTVRQIWRTLMLIYMF